MSVDIAIACFKYRDVWVIQSRAFDLHVGKHDDVTTSLFHFQLETTQFQQIKKMWRIGMKNIWCM